MSKVLIGNIKGPPGKSAYEYAVEAGFNGDETDFMTRLVANRTLYEYAQDSGYTGTEEEFNAKLVTEHLPLNGGTMAGLIDMAGHGIRRLSEPTDDSDAVTKAYVDAVKAYANTKATMQMFTYTLSVSGWSNTAPYKQIVSVEGVLSSDNPLVDIDLSSVNLDSVDDINELLASWSQITRMTVTEDNAVVAYAYKEIPTVDIPITMMIIRSGSGGM